MHGPRIGSGDPTARLLGRVSLNPMVHADPIGTVLFPLIALMTRRCRSSAGRSRCRSTSRHLQTSAARLRAGGGGRSRQQSRAGVRRGRRACSSVPVSPLTLGETERVGAARGVSQPADTSERAAGGVQHDSDSAARRRQRARGLLPHRLATYFNRLRPYGFLLLYALILTGGFDYLVVPPSRLILSWLPTR